jgi:hypothetical protein
MDKLFDVRVRGRLKKVRGKAGWGFLVSRNKPKNLVQIVLASG